MTGRLDEFRRNEFTTETDPATKERARKLSVHYRGVTPDYTVYFTARSSTGHGSYDVAIQMVDYPEIADEEDLTVQEKVRLAIQGDLKVKCTCPAYRYWGFEYINTQLGSNAGEDQERYPHIRNPRLVGILCKHAYQAMTIFPMVWNSIASDIKNGRWLR